MEENSIYQVYETRTGDALRTTTGNSYIAAGTVDSSLRWSVGAEPLIFDVNLERFAGIRLRVGEEEIMLSREEVLKALFQLFPGLIEKYTAARLIRGIV